MFLVRLGICSLVWKFIVSSSIKSVHLPRKFVDETSVSVTDGFQYGSSLRCVKLCGERSESCLSALYWKTERKCKLVTSPVAEFTIVPSSDVAWYVFRDILAFTYYPSIGRTVAFRVGSKSWSSAKAACEAETPRSRLFMVDTPEKQEVAAEIASLSGRSLIHIGVYCKITIFPPSIKWKYIDDTDLTYDNWSLLEPLLQTYGSMSSVSGYEWVARDPLLTGYGSWICEHY